MADGRPDMWKVVLDGSGHHRSVHWGQQLAGHEKTVDSGPHSYKEASRLADDLNEVAEVMSS